MGFIDYLKKIRNNYLINGVQKVNLPEFSNGEIVRKKLIFSGKVQNVGFRLETHEMGKRLGLKGWVKNREDGRVEAEAQGEIEKINYLIKHLKSIKRANVEDVDIEDIPVIDEREEFRAIF